MSSTTLLPEKDELYASTNEKVAREHPEIEYNGGLQADEDPADYYGFSIKAVRLG